MRVFIGRTLNNGALYFSLFYSDGLHLVEKGNLKLGKSILKAIDSNSNANPYKKAVCFNLNECDFPPLPSPATTSKPLYSPVKYVGPVCKPISHLFKSFVHNPLFLLIKNIHLLPLLSLLTHQNLHVLVPPCYNTSYFIT